MYKPDAVRESFPNGDLLFLLSCGNDRARNLQSVWTAYHKDKKMNIEIVGVLLERLTALASSLRTDSPILVYEVFRRGLEVMEYGAEKKVKEPRPLGSKKAYIQTHWMEKTDSEMAAVLGIKKATVQLYRRGLSLRNRDRMGVASDTDPTLNGDAVMPPSDTPPAIVAPTLSVTLNDEAKADIMAHSEFSHETLAVRTHTSPFKIKEFRVELALEFLRKSEWQKETDGAIGMRFGLKATDIGKLRTNLNLFRLRGGGARSELSPEDYIALLCGAESIKEALQNGGKTIAELFREKGIGTNVLSRERMRQIVGTIGLSGEKSLRTPLWYANKLLGSGKAELAREIANPATLRIKLAEAGGCPALARLIGVSEHGLRTFARNVICLNTEGDELLIGGGRPEMVPLVCSYCSTTFFKSKVLVEREKRKYPDRTLHFCNRSHQGAYLGEHNRSKVGFHEVQT